MLRSVDEQQTLGDASVEPDRALPHRIGRHVVIERLGHGAMGVVYAAFDPELSRKLAIKVLHRDGEVADGRLVREAQALARLSHPNVVQIYDVGTQDGAVYVAMELAAGQTMRQWLAAADRPWPEVLAVLRQAGRGLAAAHDVGIVHRDVKPDNVLVGVDGVARVVDFGLARAADGEGEGEPGARPLAADLASGLERAGDDVTATDSLGERMTRTGARLGTPAYMAPEQWTSGAVDARTDQFAFCVLAWESLYGGRPFAAHNLASLGFAITHGRIGEPPGGTRVPAWIHRLLVQGLRVDPRERHADMHTLLRALDRDPAQARRRGRTLAIAAALVGGSLWIGASMRGGAADDPCAAADTALEGIWDGPRKAALAEALRATGRSYAEDTWTRVAAGVDAWAVRFGAVRREACEATQVRHEASADAMDLRIACLDRGRQALASFADVVAAADVAVLDRAVRAAGELPAPETCADLEGLRDAAVRPDDPGQRDEAARLRAVLAHGRALEQAGHYDAAKAAIDPIVAPILALDWAPLVAELHEIVGTVAMGLGDVAAATDALRAAHLAAVRGRHDRVAWSAATALAFALAELPGRVDEARRACDLAEAQLVRADLGARPQALVANARFRVEAAAGDYPAARRHIERAIRLRESEPDEDADLAGALANYGTVVGALGEHELAIDAMRRAVAMRERVQAPGHPDVGRDLHNLGSMLAMGRHYAEAGPVLERALVIKREALGEEHPDLAYTLVALGNVAVAQDDLAAAERHFARALSIVERTRGADHPDLAFVLLGQGDVLIRQGHHARAQVVLRRALAIREAAQGPTHPEVAYVLVALGIATLEGAGGDPAVARQAAALLVRARTVLGDGIDPLEAADIDWPLARARWLAGEDRGAAIAAARAAKAAYGRARPPRAETIAAIEAWLAEHAP